MKEYIKELKAKHEENNTDKIYDPSSMNSDDYWGMAGKSDLLEEIIPTLESMTCENCDSLYQGRCMQINDWDGYNDEECQWTPPLDFGCNKFKRKN